MEAGEMSAEHDARRVEHVDETGEADPQPRPDIGERPERPGIASGSVCEHRIDGGPAAVDGPAGPRQQRLLAHLGLPAADRTAPARGAGYGVDRHVPDLAPEAGDPGQRSAADDQPATESDFPGQEDHVVGAGRRAPAQLGEGAEIGFVGHGDRRRGAER
jgi:hypothetical protein